MSSRTFALLYLGAVAIGSTIITWPYSAVLILILTFTASIMLALGVVFRQWFE